LLDALPARGTKKVLEQYINNPKPEYARSRVGIVTFHCSSHDKNGQVYVHVDVNHFTNFCALYHSSYHTPVGMTQALFHFSITYGTYYHIASYLSANPLWCGMVGV
jgi:hypothetical protein